MKIRQLVTHTICLLGLWLGLALQAHGQTRTVHYYYTNPQGTPLVKTDAQGNVIARYDYTPYGNAVTSLGSPPNGPGYTGHVNDPETGLVNMQARYYQPDGRFLSPDPIEPAPGNIYSFNRYAYVNNNPITRTDPTGMCADHYKDGTCEVLISKSISGDKMAQKIQKDMESVLNKYDKSINSLSDNKTYNVEGLKNIGVVGKLTGGEIKTLWNGTHFTVVPDGTNFRNGGDGGGTGNGFSELTPKAVSDYERVSPSPETGVSTIMFHELGHETNAGRDAAADNFDFTQGKAFEEREQKVQTIGKKMADSVGAPFYCEASAYGCY